jgi:hypothetical protein
MKGGLHLLRAQFKFEQVANLQGRSMACLLQHKQKK